MRKCILILLLITFSSCGRKSNSSLELILTSKNNDTIQELKAFYFTSLTTMNKTISFERIKSDTPNKFVFKHLGNDLYFGLMIIEKKGLIYNITIDSIQIKKGRNIISKEINLGTVRL